MTLKDILALPSWNNRLDTVGKIHEFLIDPKNDMSEKVRAMKKLRELMQSPPDVVDRKMVETYIINSTKQSGIRYTPTPGTPAGDDLARWYDEMDRRGRNTGD